MSTYESLLVKTCGKAGGCEYPILVLYADIRDTSGAAFFLVSPCLTGLASKIHLVYGLTKQGGEDLLEGCRIHLLPQLWL